MIKIIIELFILFLLWPSMDSRFIFEESYKERNDGLRMIFDPNPYQLSFPKDWPFAKESLNYLILVLSVIVVIVVILFCCCICFHLCCRSAKYNETLVVTPSELVAIGATPSDLSAAKVTPSILEESGATEEQMRQLGFSEDVIKEKSFQKKVSEKKKMSEVKEEPSGEKVPSKKSPKSRTPPKSRSPPKSESPPKFPKTEIQSKVYKKGKESNHSTQNRSTLSDNVRLMAEKVKDKPKKGSPKTKMESDVKPSKGKTTTVPKSATKDVDTISTVSTSPAKKKEAMKAVPDDTMSAAMGPTEDD